MRRRVLLAVNDMFQGYRFCFTFMWLVGLPLLVILLLILMPRGPKFWLEVLTGPVVWTVCYFFELVLLRVLKALFHDRVRRALGGQEASSA